MSSELQILSPGEDVYDFIDTIIDSGETDPFYVCDLADVMRKYKMWTEVMPRVIPFYAMKCNGHDLVVRTLATLGCNFDCASLEEISAILSLGVDPQRIIYANPTKKATHIQYAAKVGVNLMTFDSVDELEKVKMFHPKASLVLRIRHDDHTAQVTLGNKYGVRSEEEAEHIMSVARLLDLNVMGVSFHVGTNCTTTTTYEQAIRSASRIFRIAEKLGYDFTLLDIGGGFPGLRDSPLLEKIGAVVNSALDKYFPDPSVRVISEPGRYFVESAFNLLTQVSSKKIVRCDPGSKHDELVMYFLDIGIFSGLLSKTWGTQFKMEPLTRGELHRKMHPSIFWGPTCTSSDIVSDGVEYLPEMSVGEWLICENAGAYTSATATQFNSFLRPTIRTFMKNMDGFYLTTCDAISNTR